MAVGRRKKPDVVDTDTQDGRKRLAALRERYQIGAEVRLIGDDRTWFVATPPELVRDSVFVRLAGRGYVSLSSIVGATSGGEDEQEDEEDMT